MYWGHGIGKRADIPAKAARAGQGKPLGRSRRSITIRRYEGLTSKGLLARALPVAACIALFAVPGSVFAQSGGRTNDLPVVSDGNAAETAILGRSSALGAAEENSGEGYLPPTRSNVDLVSRLELREPFGDVKRDQIADVGVLKNTAYLAGWSEGKSTQVCDRGGVYSVDISNPAQPKQLAFRPAAAQNYHGEGVHAISVDTSQFKGDLLAVNNEFCTPTTTPPNQNVPGPGGGFDLYDVSNPADPKLLSRANGDYGPEGTLEGSDRLANSAHSVFLWQDDGKAYAVLVDNEEQHDIDIFDVTNPRSVQPVTEFDLDEKFPQAVQDDQGQGNFQGNFSHDMVVKEINGTQTMLMSYWDSGYVTLDVDDEANPTYIGDTDFDEEDPYTGFRPPEGNGHQAEFSHDNRHILAADEDFSQYRFQGEITGGPNDGFTFQEAGTADRGGELTPENPMSGDTRFVGEGCGTLPAATAGVNTAVFERGTCSFQVKVQNADNAGYDNVIIFNNRGTDGQRCDVLLNMTLGTYTGDVTALFVARSVGLRIIDAFDPATYNCDEDTGSGTAAPASPREGSPVSIGVLFDGWGYAHLYRNGTGKLAKTDDYAIQEGVDDRWANRFGDLSIHEFAADPETNLGYISYYSGGLRVVRFGDGGMEETGRFIDQRPDGKGNDFWGVEQFTAANGERLIAMSDRHHGLYILRYTGPGAVGPRTPASGGGAAPGPKSGRCANEVAATASTTARPFQGSAFGEQITGTLGRDVIDAGAGDDCVDGLRGNDDLRGGTGIDTLDGQSGNDRLRGGPGRGNLRGGTGGDRVSGGSAADVLFGNTGRDRLSAGAGRDQLFGGAGPDTLTGGKGRDAIEAGSGNDRIFARDGSTDMIDCGFGRDTVASRDRSDKMTSCERKARARGR